MDETYIKIKTSWTNLYRAVDSQGNTLEFLLSPTWDTEAAKRFFTKALHCPTCSAAQANATDEEVAQSFINLVEQDHRFIKRLVKPGMGFFSFKTAWRTLQGYEAMHMLRKGQIHGVAKGNITGRVTFIASLFGVAA